MHTAPASKLARRESKEGPVLTMAKSLPELDSSREIMPALRLDLPHHLTPNSNPLILKQNVEKST